MLRDESDSECLARLTITDRDLADRSASQLFQEGEATRGLLGIGDDHRDF